jgi:hypothetical protein
MYYYSSSLPGKAFDYVLNFSGALGGSFISFIFPASVYLQLMSSKANNNNDDNDFDSNIHVSSSSSSSSSIDRNRKYFTFTSKFLFLFGVFTLITVPTTLFIYD